MDVVKSVVIVIDGETKKEGKKMEKDSRDIILAPNEYAYIRDTTKGTVRTGVGPQTVTLSQQEELILFDKASKTFRKDDAQTKQRFTTAPEGW